MTTKKLKFILIPSLSITASLFVIIPACVCSKHPYVYLDADKYLSYFGTDWNEGTPTVFSLTNIYLTNELDDNQTIWANLKLISINDGFSDFHYDEQQCIYIGGDKHEINIPNLSVISVNVPELYNIRPSLLTLEGKFKCIDTDDKVVWEDNISKIYIGRGNNKENN